MPVPTVEKPKAFAGTENLGLGTNLPREYEIARLAFSWSDAIVRELAHASIEASFANPSTKARLKSDLASWSLAEAQEAPSDGAL